MPQRKQILWSQLKVGVLTVTSLVLLTIAIFLISGRTGLFTKTITVRTLAPDAAGLKTGAPVRLAGVDVGSIRSVEITGNPEPSEAIQIVMDINKDFESSLRTDSEAILAAEGLLGERYVNISKGTPKAPQVSPGATIPFRSTAEFSELVGGSRDLIDNLNVLTSRLNSIVGQIESGRGTVGKLLVEEDLYHRLDLTISTTEKLVTELSSGKGSIGRLISSDEVYDHINAAVTKLENVADQIENGDGTFQKLLHDPSLYQKADQLVSHGTVLVDNINQGQGTLGKLVQSDELYQRLNGTLARMDTVLAGLQKGEGSLGRLLHDPVLYENLNSTSVEVRELLADFRKNPKKFLTIHFQIF